MFTHLHTNMYSIALQEGIQAHDRKKGSHLQLTSRDIAKACLSSMALEELILCRFEEEDKNNNNILSEELLVIRSIQFTLKEYTVSVTLTLYGNCIQE